MKPPHPDVAHTTVTRFSPFCFPLLLSVRLYAEAFFGSVKRASGFMYIYIPHDVNLIYIAERVVDSAGVSNLHWTSRLWITTAKASGMPPSQLLTFNSACFTAWAAVGPGLKERRGCINIGGYRGNSTRFWICTGVWTEQKVLSETDEGRGIPGCLGRNGCLMHSAS